MSIKLTGPMTDINPPLMGQLHKWRFLNLTGEDIYYININTGPPYKQPPRIRRILLTVNSESSLHDTFSEPHSYPLKIADLFQIRQCIKPNQEFEIELAFSDAFNPDNFIQFSPVDSKGANIVSDIQTSYANANVDANQNPHANPNVNTSPASEKKEKTVKVNSISFKPPFSPLIEDDANYAFDEIDDFFPEELNLEEE